MQKLNLWRLILREGNLICPFGETWKIWVFCIYICVRIHIIHACICTEAQDIFSLRKMLPVPRPSSRFWIVSVHCTLTICGFWIEDAKVLSREQRKDIWANKQGGKQWWQEESDWRRKRYKQKISKWGKRWPFSGQPGDYADADADGNLQPDVHVSSSLWTTQRSLSLWPFLSCLMFQCFHTKLTACQ